MIAALTAASAVCCFGAAYATHMMLPVKPVTPAEILKNQSTLNTVNLLTFNELKPLTTQQRIDAYTSGRANLQDVMMATADRQTLNQSYVAIAKKIETFPPESTERGQHEFLKKAADDHFSGFVPKADSATPPTLPTPTLVSSAPSSRKVFSPSRPRSEGASTPTGAPLPQSSVSE
jgi:hypothetical protein